MKYIALPALAALALAACDSTPDDTGMEADAAATTEAAMTDTASGDAAAGAAVVAPTATETVTVDANAQVPNSVTIDGKDVDATVSDDGVTAKIKVD